jgi:putative molybdopterin biosynthesis protein
MANYDTVEYTRSAIAAFVAGNMADVGFGLETAARRFGLEFIPLAQEHCLFACEAA